VVREHSQNQLAMAVFLGPSAFALGYRVAEMAKQ